ncbi:LytTR family DNA-binding domain-containing protein [Spongiivirga sp. MCCC 1A20706]|uniref:LytR/AlgR family response regulator transcription factor n=1 Tax=Spongiivirga sp. MCCC 1A20706 TaxID=3160963 RepID=UPI00397753A5
MIRYIIVDDEPLAHELITEFCGMLPHLKLEKNCYNALEAIQFLNTSAVDLMFLDLNMPKLTGFEFLKTLVNPPKVIVTTAYKEFALDGYELNISDYLLKPFSFERFLKAINKAIGPVNEFTNNEVDRKEEPLRFYIKGDKKYHQIKSNEILYIEAYGNYSKLYFKEEMILSHENISHYENLLPQSEFLRIHKSFIVAKDKIKEIEGNTILIRDYKVPIGRTYKSVIKTLF